MEEQQEEEASELPDSGRPSLPPLRIHHFLALTAVAAVVFSVYVQAMKAAEQDTTVEAVWSLPSLLVGSLSLTTLGVVCLYRLSGGRTWQPGHGLLVLQGISALSTLVFYCFYALFLNGQLWAIYVYSLLSPLVSMAVAVYFAVYPGGRKPWRWVFIVLALQPLLQLAAAALFTFALYSLLKAPSSIYYLAQLLPTALALAFLLAAVLADRRRGDARHWTHGVGVVMQFAGLVLTLVLTVYYQFFSSLSDVGN